MPHPSGLLAEGPPPGCNAEFSFLDCGGNHTFWAPTEGGGYGFDFGNALAQAKQQGYVPGMPAEIWEAMQQFTQRAETAFAEALQAKREPRPVVETSYDIKLEDGTFVSTSDPLKSLAQDVVNRAGALTRPQVYGEIVVGSIIAGVGGRALAGTLAGTVGWHGPDERGRIVAVSLRGVQIFRIDYWPIPGSQQRPVLHLHFEHFGMKTHIPPRWTPGRPR